MRMESTSCSEYLRMRGCRLKTICGFYCSSELAVLEAANAAGGRNILHICGYEGARNDVHSFHSSSSLGHQLGSGARRRRA